MRQSSPMFALKRSADAIQCDAMPSAMALKRLPAKSNNVRGGAEEASYSVSEPL